MKIVTQQALRGINYWSPAHPKLIVTRVQIQTDVALGDEGEKDALAFITTHFPEFTFPQKNQANAPILALTAGIALGLQNAAGCAVSHWQCKATIYPGIYNLVLEYEVEEAGVCAVKMAIELLNEVLKGNEVEFETNIRELKSILSVARPPVKIAKLSEEAHVLNLPTLPGSTNKTLQVGYGINSIEVNEDTPPAFIKKWVENGRVGRIPILAVTGSNGKTTTTRLLAHILKTNGMSVGFTTSDGIYINHELIDEGDTTGPVSAQHVLRDTRVAVAVLETARGGILRAGLGFDACDLAVITNVQEDHLGISDIETMDDLTRVKNVVVQAVKPCGWAILNADNPYTVAIGTTANCSKAWFSTDAKNAHIIAAQQTGNPAAFIEDHQIVVQRAANKQTIAHLRDVPITFNATLGFMVENALAATLAAATFGVAAATISAALKSFYPSVAQTPGRMNIFEVQGCTVLVDFAHNPDGFAGIRDFLASVKSPFKIGIIVGTGDRKDDDTRELGRISAQMFDLTLIHQTKFLRGKTAEELVDLLVQGVHQHNTNALWLRIPDPEEPLAFALNLAKPNSYITALSDVLTDFTELIERYR
jgi:UDP-N-acetylmuramyl tripeptide synthase